MKKIFVAILCALSWPIQNAAANWSSIARIDPTETINAAVTDDAGNIYVGGSFTKVGGVPAKRVAKWNGHYWSALGSGISYEEKDAGTVFALAFSGGNLYAAGDFETAGGNEAINIAKWDGQTWSAIGTRENSLSTVRALAARGNQLFAAGDFKHNKGVLVNYIAQWDGINWNPMGSGIGGSFERVNCMVMDEDNTLYVGGTFVTAGGVTANSVARWRNGAWAALGSGLSDRYLATAEAMTIFNGELYVGGSFVRAGGVSAKNIAKWHPQLGWSALGSGLSNFYGGGSVKALAQARGRLYAGFDGSIDLDGVDVGGFAMWKNGSWSEMGSGKILRADKHMNFLAATLTAVYAGGDFPTNSNDFALSITRTLHPDSTPSVVLDKLEVEGCKLNPKFKSDNLNYIVRVESDTKSVRIRPSAKSTNVMITVNGRAVESGKKSSPIFLNAKRTKVLVSVRSNGGNSKTYTITIYKKQ